MNVSSKSSINKKSNVFLKTLIVVIVLLVLLVVLNFFQNGIKNIFYFVSSPIQKTFCSAGNNTSAFFGSLTGGGGLASENQKLKTENENLLAQVSALQSSVGQIQALKGISANCQSDNFKMVMANIIGLDGTEDVLTIDKGSADGISVGMPVINQQKVIFGKVLKIYKKYSDVMLISNKSSVVDVKVQQTNTPTAPPATTEITTTDTTMALTPTPTPATTNPVVNGAIKGMGGLGIYLDLIPVDSQIKIGDVLVTSALEGTFPKDLLVGTISQIKKDDQKPFQQASVQPFLNVKSTDTLFVITNYKN